MLSTKTHCKYNDIGMFKVKGWKVINIYANTN